MTEHGQALGPGARIQEFRIKEELGAGGFGITYLATDLSLGREVAIKEYLPLVWGSRRSDGAVGPRTSSHAGNYHMGPEAVPGRGAGVGAFESSPGRAGPPGDRGRRDGLHGDGVREGPESG